MNRCNHKGLPSGLMPPDTDWTYDKKRNAQEILPGLWLGPWGAAKDLPFLQQHISHILIIRAPEEEKFIKSLFPQLRYEVLQCRDNAFENLIRFFPDVISHVDAVLQQGGQLLIHGNAGMSRSAAFVIAYVMRTFHLDFRRAHQYVLTRRHCISLNDGFENQLREYERLLQAQQVVAKGEAEIASSLSSDTRRQSRKRPLQRDEQQIPMTFDSF
eukprot:GEMP01014301.1.p1 GENE.GEMP01014301.1~~GEMP01014301.1.p1  ORF type:complete len:214 (+),score=26.53 GEMP01014301.1:27-668(+)